MGTDQDKGLRRGSSSPTEFRLFFNIAAAAIVGPFFPGDGVTMKSPFFPVRGQRGRTAERRGAAAPGILAGVLAAALLLAAPFSSASLGQALGAAAPAPARQTAQPAQGASPPPASQAPAAQSQELQKGPEVAQHFSAGPDAPSPVIFPEQQIPLRFFHSKHRELGIACVFCHRTVQRSEQAADNNLPKLSSAPEKHEIVCLNCHQIFGPDPAAAKPPASCATCHADYKPGPAQAPKPVTIPPPNLIFNHKVHLANGIECQQCHKRVEETQVATRDNLPLMDTCLECHTSKTTINGTRPPATCQTCHLSTPDGLLRSKYPTGVLQPSARREFTHNDSWLETHRRIADADIATCANCHAKNFCGDCHE